MTIHENKHRARRDYRCVSCHQFILKGAEYFRLYGMADAGDKPYAIRLCVECKEKQEATP